MVIAGSVALFWLAGVAYDGAEVDPQRIEFELERAVSVTYGGGDTAAVYLLGDAYGIGNGVVACASEPNDLAVEHTSQRASVAIDGENRWIRVALLSADQAGTYSVSCVMNDDYYARYVLTVAVAAVDPGNRFVQALWKILLAVGLFVFLMGLPIAAIVVLFWGSELWLGGAKAWYREQQHRNQRRPVPIEFRL